eukprot:GHVN01077280.1.p1 GENE.GHVN01077280.1~~GHVN01077280.1.p1  ORF type:complete len:101 (+),score=13.53 GHVN01077280.1:1134-1436(+)
MLMRSSPRLGRGFSDSARCSDHGTEMLVSSSISFTCDPTNQGTSRTCVSPASSTSSGIGHTTVITSYLNPVVNKITINTALSNTHQLHVINRLKCIIVVM